MKKALFLLLILAFAGFNASTTRAGLPLALRTKTIALAEGTITAQMLDNGLTLVSWTPFDGGGDITVSATNLVNGNTSTNQVPGGNCTQFAGLQAGQTYRFRVAYDSGYITTEDVIVS